MKNLLTAVLLAPVALFACGEDEVTPPTFDAPAAPPDADPGPPAPPALGTQRDRMGRPAVNTALNHTFDPDATATQAAKDNWNTNANPATWAAMYAAEIADNLGILDSLDANCGNQLLAAAPLSATRYDTLAGVLADDRLYVNTANGTCAQYLGVELNAVVAPNTDCGGRAPAYDVIDLTYSVLAAGAPSGVGDTINADDQAGMTSATTFPFLAPPTAP